MVNTTNLRYKWDKSGSSHNITYIDCRFIVHREIINHSFSYYNHGITIVKLIVKQIRKNWICKTFNKYCRWKLTFHTVEFYGILKLNGGYIQQTKYNGHTTIMIKCWWFSVKTLGNFMTR